MTRNQRRAAALAARIARGIIAPREISDDDWSLLLLAAGTNSVAAPPAVVARRVLERADRGSGYFLRDGRCGPVRSVFQLN